MKILFCPTHYVFDDGDRGSELSWAYKIADSIACENIDSVVVTGFKNIKTIKQYKVVELQKEKKSIDLGVANALMFNLSYSKFAGRAIKKEKFDILHHILPFSIDNTFNFSFIRSGVSIPKIIGPIQSPLPFYRDNMEDYNSKKTSSPVNINRIILLFSKPILKYLSTLTLKKADKIVVINEKTKNMLIERNIDGKKIVIIPPGVDTKKFSTTHNISKSKIEILAVGALMERKGFDVLLKAMVSVTKKHKNIKLRILGDGPQKKNLFIMIKNLSIEKYVTIEGYVPYSKVAPYYKKADIFVSVSRAEGFATVCLEAMASGLPIVSTRVGGFSDAVVDGKNGYLVEIDDLHALSDKLIMLLDNKNKIISMGKESRKLAEEKYDWQNVIIPEYVNLYKEYI